MPDVVYHPDSPYNISGIPFLFKHFAKDDDTMNAYDDGTWILAKVTRSYSSWDYGKYEGTVNMMIVFYQSCNCVRVQYIIRSSAQE